MRVLTLTLTGALLAGGAATGWAKTKGPTLQDQQQAACYNDVQKFCHDAVPDVAKVTACMKPKKDLVSAKCRAMWDVKG